MKNKNKYFIDPFTYGKSDIFRRIAEYLEFKGNEKLTAKVSWFLTHLSEMIKKILASNLDDNLKVGFIHLLANQRIEAIKISFYDDQFLFTHLQCAVVAKRRTAFRKIKNKGK